MRYALFFWFSSVGVSRVFIIFLALWLTGCEKFFWKHEAIELPVVSPDGFLSSLRAENKHKGRNPEQQEVLQAFGGVYDSPELHAALNALLDRLISASERPDLNYEVIILDSAAVDAFLLPEGRVVYITRGLLALVNNEHELAAVLAHEISHILLGHEGGEQKAWKLAHWSDHRKISDANFSKKQEFEADHKGIEIAMQAGFDPRAGISFLETMIRTSFQQTVDLSQPAQDEFFSSKTHPSLQERIRRIRILTSMYEENPEVSQYSREVYLQHIDGMIYGDSPQDGYIRGRTFFHPGLQIRFNVPEGFLLRNARDALFIISPDDTAIRIDAVQFEAEQRLEYYVRSVWGKKRNVRLELSDVALADGLSLAYGVASYRGWAYRLAAVQLNDHDVLRFLMARQGITKQADTGFKEILKSLRRLRKDELANLHPLVIQVIRTKSSDTVASLVSCCMQWIPNPEERFRILNGLSQEEEVQPGQLVKVITDNREANNKRQQATPRTLQ